VRRRDVCRPLGRAAYESGERGIACRTACRCGDPDHEELALLGRDGHPAEPGERLPFDRWFPMGSI
jgi:hypothetical protein